MFLAGDEFGNSQYGNNNGYCQDNETSWLDWSLLEKNQDLFRFFKYMIAYRKRHPVIRKKLPDAVSGMKSLQTYDEKAVQISLPKDKMTFAVSFAGYDREKGQDDIVYLAMNTYWEDVEISLPALQGGVWYLDVHTYGDQHNQYCYEEKEAKRIEGTFIMRPRSVAVFSAREY